MMRKKKEKKELVVILHIRELPIQVSRRDTVDQLIS